MYAAVGSYIARVWRIFDFRFEPYPRTPWPQLLAAAIYVNFFAHHWLPDIRMALFALLWRCCSGARTFISPSGAHRAGCRCCSAGSSSRCSSGLPRTSALSRTPGAIPTRSGSGSLVSPTKLGAWYLLMYISFVLVAAVHGPRGRAADQSKL